jgi:hypothetical protein
MSNIERKLLYCLAVIITASSMSSGCETRSSENEKVVFNPSNYIHESVEEVPRVELFYESDTVNVEDEVNSLGITYEENMPRMIYKAIQYVDRDGIERIGIVKVYVKYSIKEDRIESEYYEVFDVFSSKYLFTCDSFDHISNKEVLYLISYGKLDTLKDIVINKGMDKEYVEKVFSTLKDKDNLSLSEVAEVYVQLVNSENRLKNEDMKLKMSNN